MTPDKEKIKKELLIMKELNPKSYSGIISLAQAVLDGEYMLRENVKNAVVKLRKTKTLCDKCKERV